MNLNGMKNMPLLTWLILTEMGYRTPTQAANSGAERKQ